MEEPLHYPWTVSQYGYKVKWEMKNGGDIQFLMVKIMADSNDNHPLAHVHSFQWSICVFHISSVSTTEKYKAQEMVKHIFQGFNI